jgi:hypothetical protein
MSISNITGVDGKLIPGVLPNPYPFPASVAGLGAVLAVNNSALAPTGPPVPQSITDVGTLSAANIQAPFGSILALNSDLIQNGVTANLGILPAGDLSLLPGNNLTLKGAQTKGSMLVGDGTSTKELIVPVAPALPNGSVLILDSTQPLGVRWGGESGDINSITPGNNIDIIGNPDAANPIVAFQSPTTTNIRLGVGTQLEAKDNYITPSLTMSIDSTGLNYKYDIAGVVNQEDIAVSSTSVIQTLSTTDTSNFQNSAILTCGNAGSGITDSKSSIDLIGGASASTTEIIDFNLQNKQEQYLVAPSANTTAYIKSNCELDFTSVPYSYFQLNTNNTATEINTGFGAVANNAQAEMSVLWANNTIGSQYQGTGGIICNNGSSNMTLTSANIGGGGSQLLRMECPVVGDALIEHLTIGGGGNLDITSTGRIDLQSTNLISNANRLEVRSTNVGGQANPLLVLQNTNATAGAVVVETYKNDPPTSTGGDVISSLSSYCNALVSGVATKVEMTRISSVAQGVGTSNNDGSISLACKVNSSLAPQNFLVCNGGLGTGEIVVSKPISSATATNLDLFCGTAGGTINLNSVSSVDITAAGDNLTLTAGALTLLDTPILELRNIPTTTTSATHNAEIKTTSNGVSTDKFLKLVLQYPPAAAIDIWIPYFTTDPSL